MGQTSVPVAHWGQKATGISLASAVFAQLFLREGLEVNECTLIVSAVCLSYPQLASGVTAVRKCDTKSTLVSRLSVCAAVNWWFWTFLQCWCRGEAVQTVCNINVFSAGKNLTGAQHQGQRRIRALWLPLQTLMSCLLYLSGNIGSSNLEADVFNNLTLIVLIWLLWG